MKAVRAKSILLTGYLEFLLKEMDVDEKYFTLLTPSSPDERGAQLSLLMKKDGKKIFKALTKAGAIVDWREPNVIRLAPAPLYNSFEDVFQLGLLFKKALK